MTNFILIVLMVMGMLISFQLGQMHALNKVEKMLEENIDDEEVEKMVGGTD